MKHPVVLSPLLLLCITGTARSQFSNFPDSNAIWIMGYYEQAVLQYYYGYHLRSADPDTLLNGIWYTSLWYGFADETDGFSGGLREDVDHRVYYFHPNTNTEYLLYDFAPEIGDSMEVWIGEAGQPFASLSVMHISSVELLNNSNGTPYNRVGILSDFALNSGEMVSQYWVEGVGGTGGLLSTNGTAFTPFSAKALECMQYNDTLWPDGLQGQCWQTAIPVNEPKNTSNWFHPTVTSDMLYLENSIEGGSVTVFSIDGRLVSRPASTGYGISLGSLNPGAYVLRSMDDRGRMRQGKFLKE